MTEATPAEAPEQDPGRMVVRIVERDGLGRDRWYHDRVEVDGKTGFRVGVHLDYASPRRAPGQWTRWRVYADGTEEQVRPGETLRGPNGGW